MNKIKRYFRGVVEQGKMVRWPKKNDLFRAVGIVLIVVTVAAVALVLSDTIVSALLQSLEKQFSTTTSSETTAAIAGVMSTIL